MPPAARALSTLSRIDYEDAFLLDVGGAHERTAEQWARAILEDAPITLRHLLLAGWSAIGLKLSRSRSSRLVLGWQLRRRTPDFVLLAADSRIGMPGQVLCKRQRRALLFATFVQHDNLIAHALWRGVEPAHVPVVRYVLEHATSRCRP